MPVIGEALMHFKSDGGDVLLVLSLPPSCSPVLSIPPLIAALQDPACYPLTAYTCATTAMFEKFRELQSLSTPLLEEYFEKL